MQCLCLINIHFPLSVIEERKRREEAERLEREAQKKQNEAAQKEKGG